MSNTLITNHLTCSYIGGKAEVTRRSTEEFPPCYLFLPPWLKKSRGYYFFTSLSVLLKFFWLIFRMYIPGA